MLRRSYLVVSTLAMLTLALTACGPSDFAKACVARGGEAVTVTTGYYPIVINTGKTTTTTLVPITEERCIEAEDSSR